MANFPKRPGEIAENARDLDINIAAANNIRPSADKDNINVLDGVLAKDSVLDYSHLSKNASEYLVYASDINRYIHNSRPGVSGVSKQHILFGIQEEEDFVDVYQTTITDTFSSDNLITVSSASGSLIAINSGDWDTQLADTNTWSDKFIKVINGDDIGSIYNIVSYNSSSRTFTIQESINDTIASGDVISIVNKSKDESKPFWKNVPVFDAGSAPTTITTNGNDDLKQFVTKAYFHDKDSTSLSDRYYVILSDYHLVTRDNILSSEIDSSNMQFSNKQHTLVSGAFDEELLKDFANINDYTQLNITSFDDLEFIDADTFEVVQPSDIGNLIFDGSHQGAIKITDTNYIL